MKERRERRGEKRDIWSKETGIAPSTGGGVRNSKRTESQGQGAPSIIDSDGPLLRVTGWNPVH